MSDDRWTTATAALRLSTRLVDAVQVGVISAGVHDVTPLHGFAFARIAEGDATTADLATHLAISKQAAAQLTDRLVSARATSHVDRIPRITERDFSNSPHEAMPAPRRLAMRPN